ncbi:hypothetical protein L227DRAFT_468433, partial [Lentinus tigrinus ALCF2SS1-6]
ELWLDDGNIVLIANNVAFRVYQGILKDCSDVFRKRLKSMDQSDERFEDCPVISIEGDPADLRHLFLVLFRRRNYFTQGDEPQTVPFTILASLIRAAHLYDVKDVLNDAMVRLQRYYTCHLDEWDDQTARKRHVSAVLSDAVTVLEISRLTGTPSLLLPAFIDC